MLARAPRPVAKGSNSKPKRYYSTQQQWKPTSPTWIDKNTKVIIQGFTGKQARRSSPHLSQWRNQPLIMYLEVQELFISANDKV